MVVAFGNKMASANRKSKIPLSKGSTLYSKEKQNAIKKLSVLRTLLWKTSNFSHTLNTSNKKSCKTSTKYGKKSHVETEKKTEPVKDNKNNNDSFSTIPSNSYVSSANLSKNQNISKEEIKLDKFPKKAYDILAETNRCKKLANEEGTEIASEVSKPNKRSEDEPCNNILVPKLQAVASEKETSGTFKAGSKSTVVLDASVLDESEALPCTEGGCFHVSKESSEVLTIAPPRYDPFVKKSLEATTPSSTHFVKDKFGDFFKDDISTETPQCSSEEIFNVFEAPRSLIFGSSFDGNEQGITDVTIENQLLGSSSSICLQEKDGWQAPENNADGQKTVIDKTVSVENVDTSRSANLSQCFSYERQVSVSSRNWSMGMKMSSFIFLVAESGKMEYTTEYYIRNESEEQIAYKITGPDGKKYKFFPQIGYIRPNSSTKIHCVINYNKDLTNPRQFSRDIIHIYCSPIRRGLEVDANSLTKYWQMMSADKYKRFVEKFCVEVRLQAPTLMGTSPDPFKSTEENWSLKPAENDLFPSFLKRYNSRLEILKIEETTKMIKEELISCINEAKQIDQNIIFWFMSLLAVIFICIWIVLYAQYISVKPDPFSSWLKPTVEVSYSDQLYNLLTQRFTKLSN